MSKIMLAALLAALLPAWAARAQESLTLYKSTLWSAYLTKTAGGRSLCGIGTSFGNGRHLYIKWIAGADDLVVQMARPGWAIPAGVITRLAWKPDGATPAPFQSVALDQAGDVLEFRVPNDQVRGFTKDFTSAGGMLIQFPGGGEPTWDIGLAGNSGAVDAMVKCVANIAAPGDPQPFGYLRR